MSPRSQGVSFHIFDFCNRIVAQKVPEGPPFTFCGAMRLPKDFKQNSEKTFGKVSSRSGTVEENSGHFEVLLLFWSLRYGAGFGRTWIVYEFDRNIKNLKVSVSF